MKKIVLVFTAFFGLLGISNVKAQNGTGSASDNNVPITQVTPQITPPTAAPPVVTAPPMPTIAPPTATNFTGGPTTIVPAIPTTPASPAAPTVTAVAPAPSAVPTSIPLPQLTILPPIPAIPPSPGLRLAIGI